MMDARQTYRVDVVREEAWLARVPEVPGAHTYTRSLSTLEGSVREVLVLMTGLPDDATGSFDLDWRAARPDPRP